MAIAFPFRLPLVGGVGTVGYKQYDSDGSVLVGGTRTTSGIVELPTNSGQYWAYNDSPDADTKVVIADDAAGNYSKPIPVNAVSKERMNDDGFAVPFELPLEAGVGTVGYRQYDVNGSVLGGGARTTTGIVEITANTGSYWAQNPSPTESAWFIIADDAASNYSNITKVVEPAAFRGPSSLGGPQKFFLDNSFGPAYYVILNDASFDSWVPADEDFAPYTTDTTSFAIQMSQNGSTGRWEVAIPGPPGHRTWAIYQQSSADDDEDASVDEKVAEGFGYWNGESMELGVAVQSIGMSLLRGTKITVVDGAGISGLTSLKAILLDARQRVYNTSTQTINTSINSIPWTLACNDLTEKAGEAAIGTAIYEMDMPTVPAGPYTLMVQVGTNPAAQRTLAEQFYWDGQQVIPLSGILLDAFSYLRATAPVGGGDISKTLSITAHNGGPIPQATVRVTTDAAGQNVIAGDLLTDELGNVTFLLNAGAYYAWAFKANTNIVNPKSFNVP